MRWQERWLWWSLVVWGVGCLTLEALAAAGMAACALGVAVVAWQERLAWREVLRRGWPLVVFMAWALVAPLLAGRTPSGTGVARVLDWVGVGVAAVAVGRLAERQRVWLAWGVGGVLVLSCVVAGLQHFGVWPPEEAFQGLAWTRLPFHRVYEAVPGAEGRYMAGGLVLHRLKFANGVGLGAVFALGMGLRLEGRRRQVALGLACVGLVSVVLFPYARSASVSLVAAAGVVVLVGLPRRVALVACVGLVGVVGGAVVGYAPLRERFSYAATEEGSGGRSSLLEAGLRAVRAHPVVGVGAGRFQARRWATEDMPEQVREHPGKAHNQYLSMAAEAGVPGAVLFVVMLAWLLRLLPLERPEGLGALGALVFFCLLSLTHDPLFHVQVSQGLMLVLGAGLSAGAGGRTRK